MTAASPKPLPRRARRRAAADGRRSGSCARPAATCRNIERSAAESRDLSRFLLCARPGRRGDAAAGPPLRLRRGDPVLGYPGRARRAGPAGRLRVAATARASTRSPTKAPGGLRRQPDWTRLAPVFEALDRLKTALPSDVALIGFCGAPWTVASYMIAGRGTPDQAPARLFAYRQSGAVLGPDRPARRRLGRISGRVNWRRARKRCRSSIPGRRPAAGRIRSLVRRAGRGARRQGPGQGAAGADHRFSARRGDRNSAKFADIPWHRRDRPRHGGRAERRRRRSAGAARAAGQSRPAGAGRRRRRASTKRSIASSRALRARAHIFNLGHGILPETPVEHVERLVARVRGER